MKTGKTKSYDLSYIMLAHQILLKDPARQMTITALALEVGLNPTKLQEGFKDIFRQTIHQYRLDLRLSLAMPMLDETDMTIAEIAYKLGFDSREGLTRCFRKKYARPPRAWRKEHDEEEIPLRHAV